MLIGTAPPSGALQVFIESHIFPKRVILLQQTQQKASYRGKVTMLFFCHPWLFYRLIVMHLIRNLKCLWFIIIQNFSMPSLSIPHNSSRLCLLVQSIPPKYRRPIRASLSILSVSLVSLSRLNLGWIIKIYWFVSWPILYIISSAMRQFYALKGVVAFCAWPVTPRNFVRIFCHLHQICVVHFTLPHLVLSFPMKQLSVAST
jgi:hypothetical protein